MKKLITLSIVTLLFISTSKGQLTKNNWLVGGNVNFQFASLNEGVYTTKTTDFRASPNIGYFFIDKFAGGIRLTYNRSTIKSGEPNNSSLKFINYFAGPFVRYYLLPTEGQYNIITEASYQFGKDKAKLNSNTNRDISNNRYSISAGPAIYLNSSVGLEFLLIYSSSGNNLSSDRGGAFGASLGFQIHLEKDKN